jgi:hypothetical protein
MAFLAQKYRDERIGRLIDTINDTCEFMHEVEPLKKVKSHKQIIVQIMQQTTECGYFILKQGFLQVLPYSYLPASYDDVFSREKGDEKLIIRR